MTTTASTAEKCKKKIICTTSLEHLIICAKFDDEMLVVYPFHGTSFRANVDIQEIRRHNDTGRSTHWLSHCKENGEPADAPGNAAEEKKHDGERKVGLQCRGK